MANTIHNWPPTSFDIPCAGEQFKKWQRFIYKGESFVRFPSECCDCDTVNQCLEAIYAEGKQFVPVMGNHGVPLMQIIEPAQPRPEVKRP